MRIGAWTQLQRRKRSTAVKLKDAAPKCRSARAQVAELKKWTACEPAGPLPCRARSWLERLTFSIMWWIDGLVISDAIDYGVWAARLEWWKNPLAMFCEKQQHQCPCRTQMHHRWTAILSRQGSSDMTRLANCGVVCVKRTMYIGRIIVPLARPTQRRAVVKVAAVMESQIP